MEEIKKLDTAINLCRQIQNQLTSAKNKVRQMNIKHNPDWVLSDYRQFCAEKRLIWDLNPPADTKKRTIGVSVQKLKRKIKKSPRLMLEPRSSCDILQTNSNMNTKFIRIKRSFESLKYLFQHALEISERQKNYQHVYNNHNRIYYCCH